jgi:glycosyltransferase involved in cell wall biosynthesis
MNPAVSIIVPVYNVECYLEQCLDSIVNQTEKSIEVILVNDASPDNSEDIIMKYCKKHNNFVYIKHEKNLGINATRNTGVNKARGEYILSIDSDDYIMPQMVEKMLLKAKKNDLDIVICDYILKLTEKSKFIYVNRFKSISSNEVLEWYCAIRKFILINDNAYIWNKLFKKSIYVKSQEIIQMKLGKTRIDYHEDLLSSFYFLVNAKRCGAVNEKLYIYRINLQSMSKVPKLRQIQETILYMKLINETIKEKNELKIYFFEYSAFKLKKALSAYQRYYILPISEQNKNVYSEIIRNIDESKLSDIIKNPYVGIKTKFNYVLYKFNLLRFASKIKIFFINQWYRYF